MIVGASCTAELIQDDPGGLAESAGPADPGDRAGTAELPAQGKLRRGRDLLPDRAAISPKPVEPTARVTCNMLGPTALGFRHRDDIAEIDRAAGRDGHRGERRGADGRVARRHRPAGRRAFQRAAVPRDRRTGRAAGWRRRSASPTPRPCPSASAPPAISSPKCAALAGTAAASSTRAACACPGGPRSVDFDLSHRQARLHLRRRHPCHRRRPHRPRRDGLRGRRPGLLQPRIGPPDARARQGLRASRR